MKIRKKRSMAIELVDDKEVRFMYYVACFAQNHMDQQKYRDDRIKIASTQISTEDSPTVSVTELREFIKAILGGTL